MTHSNKLSPSRNNLMCTATLQYTDMLRCVVLCYSMLLYHCHTTFNKFVSIFNQRHRGGESHAVQRKQPISPWPLQLRSGRTFTSVMKTQQSVYMMDHLQQLTLDCLIIYELSTPLEISSKLCCQKLRLMSQKVKKNTVTYKS